MPRLRLFGGTKSRRGAEATRRPRRGSWAAAGCSGPGDGRRAGGRAGRGPAPRGGVRGRGGEPEGGGLAAAARAQQGEDLAALDLERCAVDGGHRPEQLAHPVEGEDRCAAVGCRRRHGPYLITALAMSWVFTTSGRFSSASTWKSFPPLGTAKAGLPGSTPMRRLFVSTSRAQTTW